MRCIVYPHGWFLAPRDDSLNPSTSRSVLLVDQRLVDHLVQLRADGIRARGQQLGEEQHHHPLRRIDPERGARGATPGELPARAGVAARDRVLDDGEAEPEPDAVE